jgi:IS30 family transposase
MNKHYSFREISRALHRSVSTISDEIGRNSVKQIYDSHKANHKAYVRRHNASFRGKSIVRNTNLRCFVEENLLDGQSPEGISGRLKYQERFLPYVSKDVIYSYLRSPYGKVIGLELKKKKRFKKRLKVIQLKDRRFIEKRPKIIEKRERVGDLEADFIVSGKGGKGILLTAVCRKARYTSIEIIYDISVDNVHNSFLKIKERFPEMKSVTTDNDILFRMHKTLEKLLNVKIYFCHPYHSWEKGSVENINKYIRKYIPKGSDISQIDEEYISLIEKKCNERFMKCLKYKTPEEKMDEHRKKRKQKNSV